MTQQLADIVGVSLDRLKSTTPAPATDTNGSAVSQEIAETVWATAITLEFLQRVCLRWEDEWDMLSEKAERWLSANTFTGDADGAVAAAALVVTSI